MIQCKKQNLTLVPYNFAYEYGEKMREDIDEKLSLVKEILEDIESNRMPIESVCLKAARLAKLMDDNEHWNKLTDMSTDIKRLENGIQMVKPGTVIPKMMVQALQQIGNLKEAIQRHKTTVHFYVTNLYYEIRLRSIPRDIFERTRARVDKKIAEIIPEAVQTFVSVFDNLRSNNIEDWSNAVHSCRRILKDLADVLYPPLPLGEAEINRNDKKIKVGPEEYINRLMIYIEDKSSSDRYKEIVGSHLSFIGNRLDSIYQASCKGTHDKVSSIEEAERYVIYTYMIIGDILSL
jgi:hypothetical protein